MTFLRNKIDTMRARRERDRKMAEFDALKAKRRASHRSTRDVEKARMAYTHAALAGGPDNG